MSFESTHDVRVVLVREKYFSLRPKPLERWLWKQGVAPSAERVFWLHWEEGQKAGTWCSEIPLRRVAAECCLDVSTVTRAYQQLAGLGLLRRQDPGRDPRNPFHQATAITEVRVPRDLVCELDRHPNRRRAARDGIVKAANPPPIPEPAEAPAAPIRPRIPWREALGRVRAWEEKMTASELTAFKEAQRTHSGAMTFGDDTALTPEDRAGVLDWLSQLAVRPACGGGPRDSTSRPTQVASGPRSP